MIEKPTYAAPLAADETERLKRLRALEILDTGPEPIFDALARMASQICDTPISLLSLVDAERQWFKSNIGLEGTSQTPRELAFCAHAILQPDLLEVADATSDPRFRDNPLVTGHPDIRFYAGAPIRMQDGASIGTLCVIDRKPKILNELQRTTLTELALVAARALEMRQQALDLDRLNAMALSKAQENRNKDALYHAIVEEQSDLISLALPSGELSFVNSAYARHFGLTPAAMLGHNLLDYVASDDRAAVAAHLQAVCRAPGRAQSENQMRSASGEERWVAWSNLSIADSHGKVVTLHSVGRDITDRKRVEFALKASQERFRAFYESTPTMLHSIDAQGRLLFVSDTWLHKLGYTRDEVIGRLSSSFLTPSSREYATTVVMPDFFRNGRCDDIKYQMIRKDGSIMDAQLSAVLERDAQGQPLHSVAVIQDVTAENAISAALRTNEERLLLATSVNQIGIWEYDLNSGKLEWSDTMFRIFGGSRATFKGTLEEWSCKLHPEDLARSNQAFEHAIRTHEPLDFDFRVRQSDGEVRHVNARAIVIEDAHGNAARVLGTNYDVSERKQIERALAHSEQRLRLIANNLPVLISHIDSEFRYTFANDRYKEWFPIKAETLTGKSIAEVCGEDVFKRVKPYMMAALEGKDVSFELTNLMAGTPTHLLVHYLPDRDDNGVISGIFGMVIDRTESHRSQALLEASERQLRAVTDNLPVFITYIDAQERLRFINATFLEWLGVDLEWATGRSLLEVIGSELYEQRREQLQRVLQGERIEFEMTSVISGSQRYLHTTYIPDIRIDGTTHGAFTLSTDVTALKLVEQELRNLARIDTLTGLPNRRQFDEKLAEAMSRNRRSGKNMALMFLDIDRFKSINDIRGHGVGDLVLCEFAKRIRTSIRSTDTAARLAGDEFVIIVEDFRIYSEVEAIARKLVEAVRRPMSAAGDEIQISTSVGIAFAEAEEITPAELIARADHALYDAKAAGRDTFKLYRGGIEAQIRR